MFGVSLGIRVGNASISAGSPLLLDLYSSAAAAYSVRKLRTAYSDSAIRVRRSSDNTEQNIGFTALGNLDTTELTTFCGAGNGFITTWYDQSGNANNSIQTTAANQPQIVNAGSIILQNGKPSVQFDGINDVLNSSTVALKWVIAALNPLTALSYESFLGYDNRHMLIRNDSTANLYNTGSQLFTPPPTRTFVNNVLTTNLTNSTMQLFAVGSDTVFSSSRFITIGDDNAGGNFASQRISEIIAYTNNQEVTN